MPIILHACCGPCLTHCALALRADGLEPVVFFSDSNIMPRAEYDLRLASARKFADAENFELVEDDYDNAAWLAAVRGLEAEPEGGARCSACFRFNLERAARFALSRGISEFTSTLTVSPRKRSAMVFEAGVAAATRALEKLAAPAGLTFRPFDFKKRDGFLNSIRLAAKYDLYRQNYCGCAFSREPRS